MDPSPPPATPVHPVGARTPVVQLLLASASPARLRTLRQAGLNPTVEVSGVDEDALLAAAGPGLVVADQVALLARAKATAVAATLTVPNLTVPNTTLPNTVVIGCDSMLELDGIGLGKPATAATAIQRWQQLRGRSGVLHTGHHLILLPVPEAGTEQTGASKTVTATASTTVHFADLDDDEIEAYVATGEPLQVAGAFTIDGLGGPYITGIEGDHHNVVGVSLPLLRLLLADLGISWANLR